MIESFLKDYYVREQMAKAVLRKSEHTRYWLEKFEQFGICDPTTEETVQEYGQYFTTPTEEVMRDDEPGGLNPVVCPKGTQPSGIFYTQYWSYTKNPYDREHLIPRSVLRHGFLENDYKIVCSGRFLKIKPRGSWLPEPVARVLCITPKEGVSKEAIQTTINALDNAFDDEGGVYLSGEGTESQGVKARYFRTLGQTFHTKFQNIKIKPES